MPRLPQALSPVLLLACAATEAARLGRVQALALTPNEQATTAAMGALATLLFAGLPLVVAAGVARWRRVPVGPTGVGAGAAALLLLAWQTHIPALALVPTLLAACGVAAFACHTRAVMAPLLSAAALLAHLASLPPSPASPAATASGSPPSADVVLLTIDTLRADHLSIIGGAWHPVQTPNLDALARSGTLLTEGVATVPLTLPSHTTMLTGADPLETGVVRNGQVVPSDATRVAAEFQAAGYRTGAFVSAWVLHGSAGLSIGFDHYDDRMSGWDRVSDTLALRLLHRLEWVPERPRERRGDETMARALAWLAEDPTPAFLWVHLYDPHAPYTPPAPFDTQFPADAADAPGNPDVVAAARTRAKARGFNKGSLSLTDDDIRPDIAAYAGEVAWTDTLVGQLRDALRPHARLLITADHGESLDEHDYLLNHGGRVWQNSLRVPIILVGDPEAPVGLVHNDAAPLTHLADTLRAMGGLDREYNGFFDDIRGNGNVDILRSFAPPQQARRTAGMGRAWWLAWRQGNLKWVVNTRESAQLHNLFIDPDELTDLADPAEAEERRLRARAEIKALKDRAASRQTDVDPEMAEALRALGYVD